MKRVVFGAAVKIFKAKAAEYFGHRKNGIVRLDVGIFCEARPVNERLEGVTIPPSSHSDDTSLCTRKAFFMFHVKHFYKKL